MRIPLAAALFGALLAATPPPPPPPPEPPAAAEEEGPSLRKAAEKMREVERLLTRGESGDLPQVRAAEAVRILDDLLRPPPSPPSGGGGGGGAKKPPPSGGGGGSASDSPSESSPSKGGGAASKGGGGGGGGGADSKEDQKDKSDGSKSDSKSDSKAGGPMKDSRVPEHKDPPDPSLGGKPPGDRTPWGRLPAKAREEILEIRKESFPPEYRRLLEEYYKRLSEGE